MALYDHEGWNDSRDFVRPIKAISLSQNTSKMPDRRLLELKDQINLLLKGPQTAPRTSSTHIPQAYAKVVSSYPRPRNLDGPPRLHGGTYGKNGEIRKAIFKQREQINDRMTEMFDLLKKLTASKAPENILVREEARHPITKHVNSISLIRMEEGKEALGGNTRDLDSIWEETRQEYNFTRSGFKNARTVPGDGVTIPSDAVRIYKRRRQKLCDDIRT
ncbi:hypothetical protein Tco_0143481 [Tanacetum coccineum]